MRLPFFIAKRYFFSGKIKTAVNVISAVSLVGVAIGTAALVLLLSVFNGFENLLLSMYNSFDPHLKVTLNEGKTFNPDSVNMLLTEYQEILYFTDVLEEQVLMKNGDYDFIGSVKGVGKNFNKMTSLDSILIEGESLQSYNNQSVAVLGEGVAYHLSMGIGNMFSRLQLFVPKRKNSTFLNSFEAFSSSSVLPIGIFSSGSEYDSKYIITPIKFLQDLLQKNEVSAIEIRLKDKQKMLGFQKQLQEHLGKKYLVKNRLQQHAVLHKILSSERLGVFLILVFMLIIATFNIIGSLSMLMIEKKKDIQTLYNLGATQSSIQQLFIIEGMLIIIIGSFLGILLGFLLAFLQMRYSIIEMGDGLEYIIPAYPVAIRFMDLIWIEITVLIIGFVASFYPAKVLSKRLIKT